MSCKCVPSPPKMTKCTFRKFGPSGTVEKIDALCVMPLNNANEKIYVFLWFWFVLLAALSIGHLVLRATTVALARARALMLWTTMPLVKFGDVEEICRARSFGDWLVLYQLAKNLDPLVSRELAARCKLSALSLSANGIESGKCQIQSNAVADTAL